MRKRERFLISVLWANAAVIAALWFFNTIFGFNLFSATHWRYLAELQVAGGVAVGFYISAVSFVVVGLAGLYMLIVPWHRKITMMPSVYAPVSATATTDKPAETAGRIQLPERPPKLNLNNIFIPTKHDEIIKREVPARVVQVSETAENIKSMLSRIGFVVKESPSIGGVKPDFLAIGTDEALVVGLLCGERGEIVASEGGDSLWRANNQTFKSPAWQITTIVQKLSALFLEVLDPELKVSILPFVFSDGRISNRDSVQNIWDALGVKVFDDMNIFADFLEEYRPRRLDDAEKEDFGAFSDFVDNVLGYFNKNV
ncbi:MAG: hypothetical protein LBT45_01965 [Rickettsiales bacterium]|jgi:hypothetical protein|nr:hypothetical protein [Rickettsiales bacterium]